jgi:hypothetical protein
MDVRGVREVTLEYRRKETVFESKKELANLEILYLVNFQEMKFINIGKASVFPFTNRPTRNYTNSPLL